MKYSVADSALVLVSDYKILALEARIQRFVKSAGVKRTKNMVSIFDEKVADVLRFYPKKSRSLALRGVE